jgi:threonine dehydrogenase-like Zn-dependent dehydrogenase
VAAIHALTTHNDQFTILRSPVSGVDFAFDCIGIKKTMEQIVPACRTGHFGARDGGVAVLVGVPGTTVELNAIDVLLNEKHFIGSCKRMGHIPD